MIYTFDEFQASVAVNVSPMTAEMGQIHGTLGIAGEAGELVDAYKKHIAYGTPLDKVNLMEEVGDCLWYCARLAIARGIRLSDVTGIQALVDADTFVGLSDAPLLERLQDVFFYANALLQHPYNEQPLHRIVYALINLSRTAGFTLHDAANANVDKLRKRYPNGVFEAKRALNRNLDAERGCLEQNLSSTSS